MMGTVVDTQDEPCKALLYSINSLWPYLMIETLLVSSIVALLVPPWLLLDFTVVFSAGFCVLVTK